MSYAEKFLKAHGQDCSIKRNPVVLSKVSMKRSTKSVRDIGAREGYWEGLILTDAGLESGEVMTVGSDDYLIQSVNPDYMSGENAFFAVKSNAVLVHKSQSKSVKSGNIAIAWPVINTSVTAFGEIVTYRLRQEDPGLLDSTKYIFQVPKSISAVAPDRIVYNNKNFEIVSVDDVGLEGVSRIQLAVDVRTD